MGINQDKFKALVAELSDRFKIVLSRSIECLPIAEKYANLIFSFLFPAQILQQLIVSGSLQLLVMFFTASYSIFGSYIAILLSKNKRKIQELTRKLEKECISYDEWIQLANELDSLNGSDKWRKSEDSLLCDCSILKRRTKDLVEMINTDDLFNLMFRLRGGLARDQYGIQNEALFHKSPAGTLHIVEKYHQVVVHALNTVCDRDSGEIPTDAKLAFFNETRHSYGRTALLLSGGAYLGYYHMGLSKALWSQGLFPRVISGASAGSLMAAIVGTRTDSELEEVFYMPDGKLTYRTDFFKHSTVLNSEIGKKIQRLLPQSLYTLGSWFLSLIFDGKLFNLDSKHFKRVVLDNVGTYTFQEAFDRTGRIINVTVAPSNNYDPPRLLNYLTAPHVCVWSAAVASCALPGVFESSPLIVKEPSGVYRPEHEWTRHSVVDKDSTAHVYTDGSLESDLPMQQLSELFNVNHFIISQVNPHSTFLSSLSLRSTAAQSMPIVGVIVGYVRFLKAMLRDWAKNLVNLVNYRSSSSTWSTKRGMFQTLTQDYEGRENDVTITPWQNHISPVKAFLSILNNPSLEEYLGLTLVAERNTWPYIATIKAHCMIEVALDKCVQRLRKRISNENAVSKLDRTPSFYTSRSIINLSGLSVADPVPKSPNASSAKLQTLLNKNKKEARSPLSLKASNHQDSADTFVVDQTTVAPDYLDDDTLTLSVRAADAYLDLDDMEKNDVAGGNDNNGSRHSSSNNLIEDAASIHKTTNMASFYYQNEVKSHSEDELNDIIQGNYGF